MYTDRQTHKHAHTHTHTEREREREREREKERATERTLIGSIRSVREVEVVSAEELHPSLYPVYHTLRVAPPLKRERERGRRGGGGGGGDRERPILRMLLICQLS